MAGASAIALLAHSSVAESVKEAVAAANADGQVPPRMLELSVDMTDRKAMEDAVRKVEAGTCSSTMLVKSRPTPR